MTMCFAFSHREKTHLDRYYEDLMLLCKMIHMQLLCCANNQQGATGTPCQSCDRCVVTKTSWGPPKAASEGSNEHLAML